jgi:hypothetical protein
LSPPCIQLGLMPVARFELYILSRRSESGDTNRNG